MMLTDWLEARGLVGRRRRNGDARAWGLYLTSQGERFVERTKRRVLRQDQAKSRVLSAAERRQLLGLLDKLSS